MIYALAIITLFLIIFAVKRDMASKPANLNIGKNKNDIIVITMNKDILSLLKKTKVRNHYDFLYERVKVDITKEFMYSPYRLDALVYDRMIVYFDGKFNLIFGYIVDNFNYIEIGCIESEYIECEVGHEMHMRCDDSIGILGILKNDKPVLKPKLFSREADFTSYGYSLTGYKKATVRKGLLDDEIYYLHPKREGYVKIDHKCIQ